MCRWKLNINRLYLNLKGAAEIILLKTDFKQHSFDIEVYFVNCIFIQLELSVRCTLILPFSFILVRHTSGLREHRFTVLFTFDIKN